MTFRYARHTSNIKNIELFYTQIIGLEILGRFEKHDDYDGIFLGLANLNWHLEFTSSSDTPTSKFDEDDILVFYINSEIEFTEIKNRIALNLIEIETPKNPYWKKNGIQISDPDGHKIIFSLKHLLLNSDDSLTYLVKEKNLHNWSELIEYTRNLPYGRNQNRLDFSLVLQESRGTCSSKHSFLKKIADLNHIEHVKLILGIYKMNHLNTPKILSTIAAHGLDYIPEAHCYLKLNNNRIDITTIHSNINIIKEDLLEEFEIEPEQVNNFKVEYHKNYIKNWIEKNSVHLSFDQIWNIREACIKKLEA